MIAINSSTARALGATWLVLTWLVLTSLGACSQNASDASRTAGGSLASDQAATPTALPVRDLHALPSAASWRGEIPCADCAGILITITLDPDGTYRREGAYLGTNGGGDTVAAEFGRWTHDAQTRRVRLQGSLEASTLYALDGNGALRMLDLRGDNISSNLNYALAAIAEPEALTHPARIVGAFTYFADAAILVECRSGLQYPVDMSAGFLTLQRAYANAGGNGQPRMVRLSAHLDNRPAMEGSGTMVALIIDSLHSIKADDGCAASRTHDSLASTTWRLIAVGSVSAGALPVSENTEAGFAWDRDESHLTGSGGCNRFSAHAILRGTTLVGTAAGATKRLCNAVGVMEVEQRLFEILAADISLRLQSDTLVWSHGPREVARFVPRGPGSPD